MLLLRTLVLITLLFSFSAPPPSDQKALKLLVGMFDSIKSVKTLHMHIHAIERIEHSFVTADSEIKLQVHPRKLYFINPSKKLEVLFNEERHKKALVKPHVFPYLTLQLDPHGNLMRKNQHYTIQELGFEFIAKTIALTLKNNKDKASQFVYQGRALKNGIYCHLLEFDNATFPYVNYTVGEKETATSIAYKLCVNEYLLRFKNDLLNEFAYLKKGRVLKVPALFCRKAVLYIDERRMVPVSISLFDDVGLFECYEFSQVKTNPHFRPEEFLPDYPGYGF